jgi:hypothetical protein
MNILTVFKFYCFISDFYPSTRKLVASMKIDKKNQKESRRPARPIAHHVFVYECISDILHSIFLEELQLIYVSLF